MTHMEDDMMDVDEKFPSRAESDVEARARLLVRARRRRLSWSVMNLGCMDTDPDIPSSLSTRGDAGDSGMGRDW